jgi:hypothetical protein
MVKCASESPEIPEQVTQYRQFTIPHDSYQQKLEPIGQADFLYFIGFHSRQQYHKIRPALPGYLILTVQPRLNIFNERCRKPAKYPAFAARFTMPHDM